MKAAILLFLLSWALPALCQKGQKRSDQIGLSIPIIWNRTEALNVYRGALANYVDGTAVSYGFNLNYTKTLWRGLHVTAGAGYFNQRFGVPKNFLFDGDSAKIAYAVKWYGYSNLHLLLGLGYTCSLTPKWALQGGLQYNQFYTFRQKYVPIALTRSAFKEFQINRRRYTLGRTISASVGVERIVNKRLSVGMEALVPFYTRWRKDRIFKENENEQHTNGTHVGSVLSVRYKLQH